MLRDVLKKASNKYPFGPDDFFQQLIGSSILIAPFLFTEEVWIIAQNTTLGSSVLSIAITLLLGHGILYIAKNERDFDKERQIMGISLRYISLMTVSFGTILLLLSITATGQTLGAGPVNAFKVVSMISIFAVIGAATADNLI
jgi:uncharacterized membrane protein